MSNSEATGGATPGKDERPHGCLAYRTLPSFGTTCRRRCPEISGTRQEVPLAEAGPLSVLQVFPSVGTRICQEILRRLCASTLDKAPSLPDCRTVYTLRPDLFYRGFRYSVRTILSSLMAKITDGWWLPSLPRQNQQYWYKGLKLQATRFKNIVSPDTATVNEIILSGFIPASHSFNCAMLRL